MKWPRRPAVRPPGPRRLPFLGNLLDVAGNQLELVTKGRELYGDVAYFELGPLNYFLLHDPDAIHHVLVENASNYKKSRNYRALKFVLGEGLLTSEGAFWKRQRRLAQPAFHRKSLEGFASTMNICTSEMIERWRAASEPIDLHEEMMRLTFRIVGLTLMSTDVAGDASEIGEALGYTLRYANDWAEAWWNMPRYWPSPKNIRFARAKRTLDRLVLGIIEARRQSGDAGDDLLGMLMASRDADTGEPMSDEHLRDEIMTLVLAGHETTANALTFALHLLSSHPRDRDRLEAEVDAVLGARIPESSDLRALAFTRAVFDETLRLYPPAWAFEREAIADDRIGDYDIPAGAMVGIAPFSLHRHPDYWQRPEAFDPDRFIGDAASEHPRYAYLPFGGGPRTCIGMGFAIMEAQIVLARIAQELRIDTSHSTLELDPVITLRPKSGLIARITPRPPRSSRERGESPGTSRLSASA